MVMKRTRRPDDLAEIMSRFPFFEGVGTEEVGELASRALFHEYPKNNILSYRGEPSGPIYLVIRGRVKIILANEEGREVIVALHGPGGMFGLSSALDGQPQLGTAITIDPTAMARFDPAVFLSWCRRMPAGQAALVRELTRRVRVLSDKIGAHALMSTRDRLLDTLLDIADTEGERGQDGHSVSFERPTHQELAHRIGTSREVVSRLLAELMAGEMFEADGGRVIRVPLSALVLRGE